MMTITDLASRLGLNLFNDDGDDDDDDDDLTTRQPTGSLASRRICITN